ncbi:hypothetical protein [Pseudorhodoferax sp.]|uniref:hypothetical protein n=1 Tax=Pseudorhodoferax sp. TaxID=1993553 RepID=UPI0039E39924
MMTAGAAGQPSIGSMGQMAHHLEVLKAASIADRQLAMRGEPALHPSHIEIIGRTYRPTDEEVAFYRGMTELAESFKN